MCIRDRFYVGVEGSYSSPGYNFKKDLDPNYAVYAKVSVPIFEWGNMSLVIRPVYDPVKAGALGITKASMMQSVKSINDGLPVGIYRRCV